MLSLYSYCSDNWTLSGHCAVTLFILFRQLDIVWPMCCDLIHTVRTIGRCMAIVPSLYSYCSDNWTLSGQCAVTLFILFGQLDIVWPLCSHFIHTVWTLDPVWPLYRHFIHTSRTIGHCLDIVPSLYSYCSDNRTLSGHCAVPFFILFGKLDIVWPLCRHFIHTVRTI